MATYENVGLIHSPNINNNNNNNHSSTATSGHRDSQDYSANSKSSTMPKYFYQHLTKSNKRDVVSPQVSGNHSTLSEHDTSTNSNDSSKRIANTNGKFSIQKMFRQGFSSWRTKKKPPTSSLSTPPTSTVSSDMSTPPSIPSSTDPYSTMDNDSPQIYPGKPTRSASIDGIVNQTIPQRIIVTEQITSPPLRANSMDNVIAESDRPSVNHRGYIHSPWANAPTTSTRTQTIDPPSESIPLPTNSSKIPPPGTSQIFHISED